MKYRLNGNFSKDYESCIDEILIARGVEDLNEFKNPNHIQELNPYDLDNIEIAAKLLIEHLNNNNRICFVVDCDCDGVTSSAILWNYIKELYPNADLSFTVHDGKIHGIDDKVDWLINEGFDLIITPDSTSNQIDEMQMLYDECIDLIVLDHHEVDYDDYNVIPTNTIVVNNQISKFYSNKSLCGAGVVYKFCEVLDKLLNINNAHNFVDLAMLGEVADVMTKTVSETNYIMEEGLHNIKNDGIQQILKSQQTKLGEKGFPPYNGLTTIDVSFYVAPLVNAVVRTGTESENEIMFKLFISPYDVVECTKRGALKGSTEYLYEQALRVMSNCRSRQQRERAKAEEIIESKIISDGLYDNSIIIVERTDEDDILSTLTGLVCNKFVERYNRPMLLGKVNDEGYFRGSIRGNDAFEAIPDLKKYLLNTGYFEYVQGHANAAGFSMKYSDIDKLIKKANKELTTEAFDTCYNVDYIFDADEPEIYTVGNTLANNVKYFGNGVDSVKVVIKNVPVNNIFVMGADKTSAKFICQNTSIVKFKDATFVEECVNDKYATINVYGEFSLNTYNGETSLQFIVEDYDFNKFNKYEF